MGEQEALRTLGALLASSSQNYNKPTTVAALGAPLLEADEHDYRMRPVGARMPNFAAKYSSDYLGANQMAAALTALPAVLSRLFGECTFTAYYGFGANLHIDLCYVPMKVPWDVLPFFIADSVNQRIIVPGQTDFLIDSPQKELQLLFCHESDIHVDGESLGVMQRFMAAEPFSTIRFYSQAELKALPPAPRTES